MLQGLSSPVAMIIAQSAAAVNGLPCEIFVTSPLVYFVYKKFSALATRRVLCPLLPLADFRRLWGVGYGCSGAHRREHSGSRFISHTLPPKPTTSKPLHLHIFWSAFIYPFRLNNAIFISLQEYPILVSV